MKVNTTLIRQRLAFIQEQTRELSEMGRMDVSEFVEPRNAAAAESFLRRSLEAVFDVGRHILARSGRGDLAQEYKSIAKGLGELKVVSEDMATELVAMAGYRNRLVHLYHQVAPDELYRIVRNERGGPRSLRQRSSSLPRGSMTSRPLEDPRPREESPASTAVSTGTTALAGGRKFWDFEAALEAAEGLGFAGVEVALLSEWTDAGPLSPTSADMAEVVRPTEADIVRRVAEFATRSPAGIRVSGVHANRDLGALWATGRDGRQAALRDGRLAIGLARLAGAGCVVVHAWDPSAPRVTAGEVGALLRELVDIAGPARHQSGEEAPRSPVVSVENVPVSDTRHRPEELLSAVLDEVPDLGFTLDLTWASLYGNFDRLLSAASGRLVNCHVHGRLLSEAMGPRLVPRYGQLDLEQAVRTLWDAGFEGPYTLELSGPQGREDFLAARRWLSGILGLE